MGRKPGTDMHGGGTDAEGDGEGHGANAGPGWHRPLGSPAAVRLLTDLLVDRLHLVAGFSESDSRAEGTGVVEVDVELGVVRAGNRRWSAALAPLAARLAHVRPDGWSEVIDREIRRWYRAMTAVEELRSTDQPDRLGQDARSVVLRLTASIGTAWRTTRPAFGDTAWELVLDLGSGGFAALTPASAGRGWGSEERWSRVAAETVTRHEGRWAHLLLDDNAGVVLSGPFVSALLYDPGVLRARLEAPLAGVGLRATVFTNSLVLITPCGHHPAADVVTESLHRFTSGLGRRFEPFTLDLPYPEVASKPVPPA